MKNLQQLAQDADLALLQVLLWGPGETPWMGNDGPEEELDTSWQVTLG